MATAILEHPTIAQRTACYRETNAALRAGTLAKATECAWCGATDRIEGHHPDYARPMMVVWLCADCHFDHHRTYRREWLLFHTPQIAND